jgi:hypothetical protein
MDEPMSLSFHRRIGRSPAKHASIALCWIVLTAASPGSAAAQSPTADEQILAGLERAKHDGEGLVIVGADFDGLTCVSAQLEVGRPVDGKMQKIRIEGMSRFFGSLRNFQPKGLGAGTWILGSVKCVDGPGGGGMLFAGPYAKFDVVAGGVIDAGTLKINHTRDELMTHLVTGSATIRLSVLPTSELRTTELKKVIPRVMALAKKRPMVLISAPVQKVKRRGLL